MKTKVGAGLMVIAVLMGTFGCGTILNDKNPPLTVTSTPDGADVHIDGSYAGRTPLTTDVSIKREHTVTATKEGYQDNTKIVGNHAGALWIVLDILLTGLIGLVVDAITGDWQELDRESVHLDLKLEPEPSI